MVRCKCCRERGWCNNQYEEPPKEEYPMCKAEFYRNHGLEVPPGHNPECPAKMIKYLTGSAGVSGGKKCKAVYLQLMGVKGAACCTKCPGPCQKLLKMKPKGMCLKAWYKMERRRNNLTVALIEQTLDEVALIQRDIDLLKRERQYVELNKKSATKSVSDTKSLSASKSFSASVSFDRTSTPEEIKSSSTTGSVSVAISDSESTMDSGASSASEMSTSSEESEKIPYCKCEI